MRDGVACNQVTSTLVGRARTRNDPGVLLPKADTADLSFVIGSYITEVHTDSSQTRIFAH